MSLAAISLLCSSAGATVTFQSTSSRLPSSNASFKVLHLKGLRCSAAGTVGLAPRCVLSLFFLDVQIELENRKSQLLTVIRDTKRGLVTTAEDRFSIEEALVSVEGFDADRPIDLGELDGTWRLQYTSAPDVLILLESATRLPFFEIGPIFQKFECRDKSNGGVVRNVVKWSIPKFLEEQEGVTLLVSARFSVVSQRNIFLQFQEIAIQNININEELQGLIAPALLPRSYLTLEVLQFIRAFKAEVPVRNQWRRSVGGLYYLSYLDRNMLLGRTVGGGGIFVFTRAQALL